MQQDDDWRLNGQDRYLTGAKLEWAEWQPPRPSWDHDHCEFCWAKFAEPNSLGPESLGALHAGFATSDRSRWVCPQCFADFRKQFGWLVIGSVPDTEPDDGTDSQ